MLDEQLKLGLH